MIGGYQVLVRLEMATREIFLVKKGGEIVIMKTLTLDKSAMSNDPHLPGAVQDQIETELERWEVCKDMNILNPILDSGRDHQKCCTCFVIQPYLGVIIKDDDSLIEKTEDERHRLASLVHNRLVDNELHVDDITFDELVKPSSWGITDEGDLILIDYGV